MAVSQADIDALDAAIVSGKKSMRWQGRYIEWASLEEMLKARSFYASQLERSDARSNRKALLIRPRTGL